MGFHKPLLRPAVSGEGTWPGGGRLTIAIIKPFVRICQVPHLYRHVFWSTNISARSSYSLIWIQICVHHSESRWLATPKRWRFVRGHDKPMHGSCAIYFPGGIIFVQTRGSLWVFDFRKSIYSSLCSEANDPFRSKNSKKSRKKTKSCEQIIKIELQASRLGLPICHTWKPPPKPWDTPYH